MQLQKRDIRISQINRLYIKVLVFIRFFSLFSLIIFIPLARGGVQVWAITVIHMITIIGLTSFLLEKIQTLEWMWIKTPLDKPIIVLLIICLLSSMFSMHRPSSLWAMALLTNYIIVFYLVIHSVNTRSWLRWIVYIIIGIAIFLAIFGMLKQSGVNPFSWWTYSDATGRLNSTFGNANHLAGYMEMTIPLLLGLTLTGLRKDKLFFTIILVVLLIAALLLSLSRGGWMAAFSSFVFMAAILMANRHFQVKKIIITIVCVLIPVMFIALSSTSVIKRILTLEEKHDLSSFSSRLKTWGGVVEMIQDYPLFGSGPGTFAVVYTQYHPPGYTRRSYFAHNDYLHFISETGFPMAVVIVWVIIVFYRHGFKKMKNRSRLVHGITLGAMSGITAILIHSISDFNLHIPANALLFTVLAAIVVSPVPISKKMVSTKKFTG